MSCAPSILIELIRHGGARNWEDTEVLDSLIAAANYLAAGVTCEELMPNKILVQAMDGTPRQIVFADHGGDFSPTAANDLRVTTDGTFETDVELDLTGVADNAFRQSAKFDLGENRAERYAVRAALEYAATPTAGTASRVYIGWSQSGTAGTANPANLTGSDAAYSGYSSNGAASVLQLDLVGVLVNTAQATATVQVLHGGEFTARGRYGCLVFENDSGAAIHSDDVECHIVLDPIVPEIQ